MSTIPIYFDCEFTELSRRGTLISIGMTDDKGHEFYAELNDYDDDHLNDFIKETVLPNLTMTRDGVSIDTPNAFHMRGNTEEVRNAINKWFQQRLLDSYKSTGAEYPIQFYSDCYAYDWMIFCEMMWGNGFDIPQGSYSYIPIDLSTALWAADMDPDTNREEFAGVLPGEKTFKHNALWDAHIIRRCFHELRGIVPVELEDDEDEEVIPVKNNFFTK